MDFALRAARNGTGLREVRYFPTRLEVRGLGGDEPPVVVGYATVYDEPYEVWDWLGSYTEEVTKGAASKTVKEADVRYFYNHDGLVLARTRPGTLKLSDDDHGVRYEATLDTRQSVAMDLAYAIDRGDLDGSSMAFEVLRQEWNGDYDYRWIKELKLFDVSTVAFPANPATDAGLRMQEALEAIVRGDAAPAMAELREISTRNPTLVREAIGRLEALLEGRQAQPPADLEPDRDTPSTISLDMARRTLTLLELESA